MKQEIMEKWVEALRSGRYEQGRGRLRRGDKYCCLGVLCEVLEIPADLGDNDLYSYLGRSDILPRTALDLSGMRSISGVLKNLVRYGDGHYCSLMALNDDGVPFGFIADVIENHWEEL